MNTTLNKKMRIAFTAMLLLISFLPLRAFAEEPDKKEVRVGYFTMDSFMEGGVDGSVQSGLTYELLCEIGTYNHWDIEFVYGDFSDLYQQLTEGKIDILPNIIDTDERKEQVLFHDLVLNEEHYYISALRSSVPDEKWDISFLEGKRLATVRNAYEELIFDEWASKNGISMEKVYCDGFDEAWQLVRDGNADCVLNINNAVPGTGFVSLCEVGEHGVFFAVAKGRQDILSDIDYALEMIKDISPFLLNDLREKYLNDSLSSYQLSPEEQTWVKEHSVLRIGGLKNDIPYAYENEDGQVVGTYVELTELILGKLGIDSLDVQWSLYPTMSELHTALKNGELDLICPEYHSYYEAEKNGFAISETVMNIPMGLLSLGTVDLDGMDSIATGGERPGLVYVSEAFPDAKVVPLDTVEELVKAVTDGRVAGAIAHIYALQDEIRNSKTKYTLSPVSAPCLICYASLEQNNELIMLINRGYHLIKQAERNSIEVRYGTSERDLDTTRKFLKKNIEAAVILIVCVIAALTYAVYRSLSAGKLKKTLESITQKNAIIEAARRELETAKEEAQAASRAKSTFLFNMSHDIRTPMNAIIGFTDMAQKHIDDPEKVQSCLEKVSASSKHLLSLINDVLDMARIESGKLQIEEQIINIREASKSAMAIASENAKARNIDLTLHSGPVGDAYIYGDPLKISQIALNIMSNAIKYTDPGGKVDIRVDEVACDDPDRLVCDLIVADTGIGMSEEFLTRVFEPFERSASSTQTGIQGTGLGMAITKELVEKMGGQIWIESRLGVGTTVTVRFDFRRAAAADAQSELDVRELSDFDFNGKRVLLVEDNELNREIAEDILSEEGLIVDTAEDGDEAVELMRHAEKGKYDLILMDIQMPRMNGYDATRAIRSLPDAYASGVPIIAMTANAFEEDKQNALAAGMNGHLAKPVDIGKLRSALVEFLA